MWDYLIFVLPTQGSPYLYATVKDVSIGGKVGSVENLIKAGCYESIKLACNARYVEKIPVVMMKVLIHPLFASQKWKWKWASTMIKHDEVLCFGNEEGVNECTPNPATIIADKEFRSNNCPHLWGNIVLLMTDKTFLESTPNLSFTLRDFSKEEYNESEPSSPVAERAPAPAVDEVPTPSTNSIQGTMSFV